MYALNDKVVIITGASGGIGRAIAERLALEGAAVVVNYGKSADKAKEVVAAIESRGGKAVAIQADMSCRVQEGSRAPQRDPASPVSAGRRWSPWPSFVAAHAASRRTRLGSRDRTVSGSWR